jgi:Zn-dependent protease
MRWSLPIGRIAGVAIRVNVSFLALALLVAWAAHDVGESPVEALAWLVAIFACVVVHELAHAMVARSKDVAVDEIDLMAIGGVSRLQRIPEDWRDESAIAIAGPVASIVIGLLAFGAGFSTGHELLPVTAWSGAALTRLGWLNLMLAGFNLLPAFPMDGGRVLRALLERDRSRVEATRVAVRVSRILAAVMIGAGFLVSVWLVVIGVFVLFAGRAEEAAVLVHAALAPVPAAALAVPSPVTLVATMQAADAALVAAANPQVAYAVHDGGGAIVGAVERARLLSTGPRTLVRDLMSGSTVEDAESLEALAEHVMDGPVVVTHEGRLVGVVTRDQVASYLAHWSHRS